jgi:hypothetical protein
LPAVAARNATAVIVEMPNIGRNSIVPETQELDSYALLLLMPGDEMAVLPLGSNRNVDVLEISVIRCISESTIRLANGRLYCRTHGCGLVTSEYITLATEEHLKSLADKNARIDHVRHHSGESDKKSHNALRVMA